MRIIIVGRSCAGKDTLKNLLVDKGLAREISYTTRPIREGEKNGVDYYFKTDEEFKDMIDENLFYEHQTFNKWRYGTTKEQWHDKDVFIFTPSGVKDIKKEDRKSCFIVYLTTNKDIIEERMKKRIGNADSMQRRIEADEKDFSNFIDYDLLIDNSKKISDLDRYVEYIYGVFSRSMKYQLEKDVIYIDDIIRYNGDMSIVSKKYKNCALLTVDMCFIRSARDVHIFTVSNDDINIIHSGKLSTYSLVISPKMCSHVIYVIGEVEVTEVIYKEDFFNKLKEKTLMNGLFGFKQVGGEIIHIE